MASSPAVAEPLLQDPENGIPMRQPGPAESDHWTRTMARRAYTQISSLSTSVFFGIITAFCLKSIGQSVAIAIVLLFIAVQVLSYYGFINMSAVTGVVKSRLDVDGNGRVDFGDVRFCCSKILGWALSWGVPSALAFVFGFWLGWKLL